MYEGRFGEQQEDLLLQFGGGSPLQDFSDRMEAHGAVIEDALTRCDLDYATMFFGAGVAACLCALISFTNSLWVFSLGGVVQGLLLLAFSVGMLVLDFPGAPRWAAGYRRLVRQQVRVLTKVSGRGLCYIYLSWISGAAVLASGAGWWGAGSTLGVLLGLSLALAIFVCGVIGLSIGFRKSLMLDKVKKQIVNHYKGNASEIFRKYAVTDSQHGLMTDEFARLAADYSNGHYRFSQADIILIFSALDDQQKGSVNEAEFNDWISGYMTYL